MNLDVPVMPDEDKVEEEPPCASTETDVVAHPEGDAVSASPRSSGNMLSKMKSFFAPSKNSKSGPSPVLNLEEVAQAIVPPTPPLQPNAAAPPPTESLVELPPSSAVPAIIESSVADGNGKNKRKNRRRKGKQQLSVSSSADPFARAESMFTASESLPVAPLFVEPLEDEVVQVEAEAERRPVELELAESSPTPPRDIPEPSVHPSKPSKTLSPRFMQALTFASRLLRRSVKPKQPEPLSPSVAEPVLAHESLPADPVDDQALEAQEQGSSNPMYGVVRLEVTPVDPVASEKASNPVLREAVEPHVAVEHVLSEAVESHVTVEPVLTDAVETVAVKPVLSEAVESSPTSPRDVPEPSVHPSKPSKTLSPRFIKALQFVRRLLPARPGEAFSPTRVETVQGEASPNLVVELPEGAIERRIADFTNWDEEDKNSVPDEDSMPVSVSQRSASPRFIQAIKFAHVLGEIRRPVDFKASARNWMQMAELPQTPPLTTEEPTMGLLRPITEDSIDAPLQPISEESLAVADDPVVATVERVAVAEEPVAATAETDSMAPSFEAITDGTLDAEVAEDHSESQLGEPADVGVLPAVHTLDELVRDTMLGVTADPIIMTSAEEFVAISTVDGGASMVEEGDERVLALEEGARTPEHIHEESLVGENGDIGMLPSVNSMNLQELMRDTLMGVTADPIVMTSAEDFIAVSTIDGEESIAEPIETAGPVFALEDEASQVDAADVATRQAAMTAEEFVAVSTVDGDASVVRETHLLALEGGRVDACEVAADVTVAGVMAAEDFASVTTDHCVTPEEAHVPLALLDEPVVPLIDTALAEVAVQGVRTTTGLDSFDISASEGSPELVPAAEDPPADTETVKTTGWSKEALGSDEGESGQVKATADQGEMLRESTSDSTHSIPDEAVVGIVFASRLIAASKAPIRIAEVLAEAPVGAAPGTSETDSLRAADLLALLMARTDDKSAIVIPDDKSIPETLVLQSEEPAASESMESNLGSIEPVPMEALPNDPQESVDAFPVPEAFVYYWIHNTEASPAEVPEQSVPVADTINEQATFSAEEPQPAVSPQEEDPALGIGDAAVVPQLGVADAAELAERSTANQVDDPVPSPVDEPVWSIPESREDKQGSDLVGVPVEDPASVITDLPPAPVSSMSVEGHEPVSSVVEFESEFFIGSESSRQSPAGDEMSARQSPGDEMSDIPPPPRVGSERLLSGDDSMPSPKADVSESAKIDRKLQRLLSRSGSSGLADGADVPPVPTPPEEDPSVPPMPSSPTRFPPPLNLSSLSSTGQVPTYPLSPSAQMFSPINYSQQFGTSPSSHLYPGMNGVQDMMMQQQSVMLAIMQQQQLVTTQILQQQQQNMFMGTMRPPLSPAGPAEYLAMRRTSADIGSMMRPMVGPGTGDAFHGSVLRPPMDSYSSPSSRGAPRAVNAFDSPVRQSTAGSKWSDKRRNGSPMSASFSESARSPAQPPRGSPHPSSSVSDELRGLQDDMPDPADPEALNRLLPTAFAAVRHNKYDTVESLLKDYPNLVESADAANKGNSLLHVACSNGFARIAKLILKYGANIDAVNAEGNSPLHLCYQYGRSALVSILIAAGANENARNKRDQVPAQLLISGSIPASLVGSPATK